MGLTIFHKIFPTLRHAKTFERYKVIKQMEALMYMYLCILFQSTGIEPKTLKYWIHNSKQKWKRQPGQGEEMIAAMDS